MTIEIPANVMSLEPSSQLALLAESKADRTVCNLNRREEETRLIRTGLIGFEDLAEVAVAVLKGQPVDEKKYAHATFGKYIDLFKQDIAASNQYRDLQRDLRDSSNEEVRTAAWEDTDARIKSLKHGFHGDMKDAHNILYAFSLEPLDAGQKMRLATVQFANPQAVEDLSASFHLSEREEGGEYKISLSSWGQDTLARLDETRGPSEWRQKHEASAAAAAPPRTAATATTLAPAGGTAPAPKGPS